MSWLPSGPDFQAEATEFLVEKSADGEPFFDAFDAYKAHEQELELRADTRDWEGVVARILDPADGTEGEAAAIALLRARATFDDPRIVRSLRLLLDQKAEAALRSSKTPSEEYISKNEFKSLVAKFAKSGSPELIRHVFERLLEKESSYYRLFDESTFRFFLDDIGARGTELHVPELNKLAAKLESDNKDASAERARIASISITRRTQSRQESRTSKHPSTGPHAVDSTSEENSAKEPGGTTPYLIVVGVLTISVVVIGTFILVKRR